MTYGAIKIGFQATANHSEPSQMASKPEWARQGSDQAEEIVKGAVKSREARRWDELGRTHHNCLPLPAAAPLKPEEASRACIPAVASSSGPAAFSPKAEIADSMYISTVGSSCDASQLSETLQPASNALVQTAVAANTPNADSSMQESSEDSHLEIEACESSNFSDDELALPLTPRPPRASQEDVWVPSLHPRSKNYGLVHTWRGAASDCDASQLSETLQPASNALVQTAVAANTPNADSSMQESSEDSHLEIEACESSNFSDDELALPLTPRPPRASQEDVWVPSLFPRSKNYVARSSE